MTKWIIAFLLVSSVARAGDSAVPIVWADRLALLTNGMSRAEVERLFPCAGGMECITGSGSGYGITYNIDDNWAISLAYDWTGLTRDTNGVVVSRYSPSNRLGKVYGLKQQPKAHPVDMSKTTISSNQASQTIGAKATPQSER